EAGLALPKVKPQDFIGKEAYLAARDGEPATRLCTLTVEDHLAGGTEPRFLTGTCPVLTSEGEPITDARGRRSYTTSEGPAPSLGRYLALAYLPGEYAHVGTELLVEYFGRRYPVSVIEVGRAAPFDPELERGKSESAAKCSLRKAGDARGRLPAWIQRFRSSPARSPASRRPRADRRPRWPLPWPRRSRRRSPSGARAVPGSSRQGWISPAAVPWNLLKLT